VRREREPLGMAHAPAQRAAVGKDLSLSRGKEDSSAHVALRGGIYRRCPVVESARGRALRRRLVARLIRSNRRLRRRARLKGRIERVRSRPGRETEVFGRPRPRQIALERREGVFGVVTRVGRVQVRASAEVSGRR
jgi:hypothetical protein